MNVQFKDYYEVLGLSREASEKDIKSAYRKLARQYHPDVNPGAEARFKEINEAYEVLGDPEKRKRYDSLGANWRHGANFTPPPDFDGFNFNFGDFNQSPGGFPGGGSGTFSDFFEMLFGQMGMGGGAQRQHQHRVDYGDFGFSGQQARPSQDSKADLDLIQTIDLELEDLLEEGRTKTLLIRDPNTGTTRSLTVKIPKGIRPGKKIKLAGQGRQGHQQAGDLILEVQLRPHDLYTLDENDILYDFTLPLSDLVLGTEISVPSPTGQVRLKIPPATEPGKKIRIRGRGLPSSKPETESGDFYVRLKVKFPKALPDEARALFEQLRALGF